MTEIAPGMMVECIANGTYAHKGQRFIVNNIGPVGLCTACESCVGLSFVGYKNPGNYEYWSSCAFRPIGGDKEIEQQESQRTGKSAKDNIKNKELTNDYKFFIIDMDDK